MNLTQTRIGGGQQLKSSGVDFDSSANLASLDSTKSANDSAFGDCIFNDSAGQIFLCPIASSLSRLKGLDEFRGDFIELDSSLNKQKILDFYAQDFFNACDYCHNMWEKKREIPVAIQIKEVLKLSKDC